MEVAGLAIAVVVGVGAIVIAYLQWKDRRPRAQLEFAIHTKSQLIPERWSALEVMHDGQPVTDPTLMVVRIVHAGDKAIEAEDFETDIRLTFVDSGPVASVSQTGQRPSDFAPELLLDGSAITLQKTLINPGDMIELQMLVSGMPRRLDLEGRVSDVTFKRLARVPVGPGSGRGGQFERSDWILYGVLFPAMAISLSVLTALSKRTAIAMRIALPIVFMGLLVYFLLRTAWSLKRGRMWTPERLADTRDSAEDLSKTAPDQS